MGKTLQIKKAVTILFAGDSGDGIQLTGNQFTTTNALYGNDVSTFPNFPAEIRAPQGTVAGVSGFQLKFGSSDIYSPGDRADVLVVMNAAALRANLHNLVNGGVIIANTDGFDSKNLRLAGYDQENPLTNHSLERYKVIEIDVTKMTRTALVDSPLKGKDVDRCKNMFVLGFLYWMYNRKLDATIHYIEDKFKGKAELIDGNVKVLKAGFNFGDTSETFTSRFEVAKAKLPRGTYRSIMGNQATALGFIAASRMSGLELFYGSYPITPASDILHELSRHKNFGVKTFQAEDEIAAVTSAIGAAFAGDLAITASSGPGIALKAEGIGLAFMLELPLVICNVQRGGPSTGLPTKTEQSDLLQALYGRNGETPIPVLAAYSPADCFDTAFEACKIAVEHMTPVFMLTDGYLANGAEPWAFPQTATLKSIKAQRPTEDTDKFLPYKRNEFGVRPWAVPGELEHVHRVGGLEKQNLTGNISYDPENHELMVKLRQQKVDAIADFIPAQQIDTGGAQGEVLVLGWGSSYGSIKTAVNELLEIGYSVGHVQLKYINPMPKNLGDLLSQFKQILVPEINNGQLIKVLRDKYQGANFISMTKIKGLPFTAEEIKQKVIELF